MASRFPELTYEEIIQLKDDKHSEHSKTAIKFAVTPLVSGQC